MTSYRCYLFDKFRKIDQVIDLRADSDVAAYDEVRPVANSGYFELWRGTTMIHPASAEFPVIGH